MVADVDGCAPWRCYDDNEENWLRGKVLLLEEREVAVAGVFGMVKQVQRRGVFFLPTSFTVFSCLLFFFFFFLLVFFFFCPLAPPGKGVFIKKRKNL